MIHITTRDIACAARGGSVVTLGNFDGVHIGHLELVRRLAQEGNTLGVAKVVFSFFPHPSLFIGRGNGVRLLLTSKEKREILAELGVDAFLEYPFDDELKSMSPQGFVEDILVGGLGAKAVVMGRNSAFGKNRCGDVTLMRRMGLKLGFNVYEAAPVMLDGVQASSTLIRQSIAERDLELARRLMTRPYQITGIVERGRQLGRELGFPTLNVYPQCQKLLPPSGVYITSTKLPDGNILPSITNVGASPTVDGANVRARCETHVYRFDADVYSREVTIFFHKHLRNEMKFSSLEELQTQVLKDIEQGRALAAQ